MKFKNPLLVVADMEKSVEFYKKVLGLHVIMDFGANKTLTGGLCLQTLETWRELTGSGRYSLAAGTPSSILKKMTSTNFQRSWRSLTSAMSTL